jgi:hypothetical protein
MFRVFMSFDQVINDDDGILCPATETGCLYDPMSGKFVMKFEKDLSAVRYKVWVYNARYHKVRAVHLRAGRANEIGDPIATLYDIKRDCPGMSDDAGIEGNGLLCKGILRNHDIDRVPAPDGYCFNTIASLFQGIRNGNVYVNVESSGKYAQGILRAQLFFP